MTHNRTIQGYEFMYPNDRGATYSEFRIDLTRYASISRNSDTIRFHLDDVMYAAGRVNREFEHGRYDDGIRLCNILWRYASPQPDVLYNMGVAFYKLGNYGQAIKAYKKALEIEYALFEARHNLGAAFFKIGENKDAIKCMETALSEESFIYTPRLSNRLPRMQKVFPQPNRSRTWSLRGVALENLGHYEQALKSYSEALRGNPGLPQALDGQKRIFKKIK